MRLLTLASSFLLFGLTSTLFADDAKFDLPGPKIDVYVTRGSHTLPISQVPNLLPQDKLRVKMDLPATQNNHLLLIVAFLRGTTNEPLDSWFTRIETWKPISPEGTTITVPAGAQRALLFVAPETGGDFATLRSAVKGNPGTFIQAAISLDRASYDQQRIAHYMAGMQSVALSDEKAIQSRSTALATTLALKPNPDCFKQPAAYQVDCLTEASAPLLLDDGHGQTMTNTLSSGASSDFINEASTTDGGAYSAYVGTLVDLVHFAELMRTAQYRYIPAIAFPQGPTLNLMLNAAPSFNNPKSVIVIGLPAIRNAKLPEFTLPNPPQVLCLADPKMSIPLRGVPLLFSTSYAHNLTLDIDPLAHMNAISLVPDADSGGLVRSAAAAGPLTPATNDAPIPALIVRGTIRGQWGFDSFSGPTVEFQRTGGGPWKLAGTDNLEAGKDAIVTLKGGGSACIDQVTLAAADGSKLVVTPGLDMNHSGTASLPILLPLKTRKPGTYTLLVQEKSSARAFPIPFAISGPSNSKLKNPATTLQLLKLETTPHTAEDELAIDLSSPADIPLNGTLRFAAQSQGAFAHTQTIEIATAEEASRTTLSLENGLMLQDNHTIIGDVDLVKVFGESAFGELRMRAVSVEGAFGDWITLGNLVRRPHITAIHCTNPRQPVCSIEGKNLFLALAFSTKPTFDVPLSVPSGFDDPILTLPMDALPRDSKLYVKLRDGSNVLATIQLTSPRSRR